MDVDLFRSRSLAECDTTRMMNTAPLYPEPGNGRATNSLDGEPLESTSLQRNESSQSDNERLGFISNFSHELRNPLSSIVGTLDYLLTHRAHEVSSVRDLLERMDRSARHVLEVLNTLVDYSRLEAGKLALRREWTDLNVVIRSARDIAIGYVEKLGKHALTIDTGALYDLPPIHADETKIRQVLINILHNAVKFTEEGTIHLITWIENDHVHIAVKDNGIGIRTRDRDKIFKAYEQVNPSDHPYGAGLGLYISKSIVEMHGGRIWFESEYGQGTTFYVALPIHTSPPS